MGAHNPYRRAVGAALAAIPQNEKVGVQKQYGKHDDATSRMREALTTLDDRSRDILESRWLTEDKQTLHELADIYGVSAERIRQIEANAIKKLGVAMEV